MSVMRVQIGIRHYPPFVVRQPRGLGGASQSGSQLKGGMDTVSRGRVAGDHSGWPRGQHLVTAMGDIPALRTEIPVTAEAGAPLKPATVVRSAAGGCSSA